jgi:hypothetical protein
MQPAEPPGAAPRESRLGSVSLAITSLAGAIAIASELAGLPWADNRFLVVVGLALLVVGTLVVTRRVASEPLVAVLGVVTLALAALTLVVGLRPIFAPAGKAATPSVDGFAFEGHPDPVPYCAKYRGNGVAPEGYQIVMFDKPKGDNGELYAFDGSVSQTGETWSIVLHLGDDPDAVKIDNSIDLEVEVAARLLPDQDLTALEGLAFYGADPNKPLVGYWKVRALPGLALGLLDVKRGPGHGASDCK